MTNKAKSTSKIVEENGGNAFKDADRVRFHNLGSEAASGMLAQAMAIKAAFAAVLSDPDAGGFRKVKIAAFYKQARDEFKGGYREAYLTGRGIKIIDATADQEKRAQHAATQAWSARLDAAKITPPTGTAGRKKTTGAGADKRKLTAAQKRLAEKVAAMRKIVNHSQKAGIKCATAMHKAMEAALAEYNKTLK